MDRPIHFRGIRNSLIFLVLLMIFLSMVGLVVYVIWQQRRESRQQAQQMALRIARLAAWQQEKLITGAHHLLMALAALPEVRERKTAKCNQLFAGVGKNFPYYTAVGAATPEGNIFCSSLSNSSPRQPSIIDRGYFQEALNERRLSIGHVLVGRMSGKPNIPIAYPSIDSNGRVEAVVFVGLDLTWLNTVAAMIQLPPQAGLIALDEKGNVFVRYTEEQNAPDSLTANLSLVKTILEKQEGFTEADGPDGVRRLFGFTTLRRSSESAALFVAVGIPQKVAFATSMHMLYGSLVIFLIASLLAAAATWLAAHLLVRRKLEELLATARKLGDGELNETSGWMPQVANTAGQFEQVIDEMRAALEKATARQADFAAMIAHDLRNPLQTIHGAVSLLRHAGERNRNEQVFIDMIRCGCEELTQTLNEFLDFSKYKAGYLQLTKEEVNLYDFFDQLKTRYSWRAQQKHLSLVVEIEPGIGSIAADRQKLHQLLDNLLSNALKFTPADGEIRMGTQSSQGGIELWVKDTGVGIDVSEIKTLFSRYGQTVSSRWSSSKGTGLGLLICKMIAEAHGGQITVQSELGKGTLFRVWFPRATAPYVATDT
jgi:signal transduction histidine kinase